jgi:hypothetical protein
MNERKWEYATIRCGISGLKPMGINVDEHSFPSIPHQ